MLLAAYDITPSFFKQTFVGRNKCFHSQYLLLLRCCNLTRLRKSGNELCKLVLLLQQGRISHFLSQLELVTSFREHQWMLRFKALQNVSWGGNEQWYENQLYQKQHTGNKEALTSWTSWSLLVNRWSPGVSAWRRWAIKTQQVVQLSWTEGRIVGPQRYPRHLRTAINNINFLFWYILNPQPVLSLQRLISVHPGAWASALPAVNSF